MEFKKNKLKFADFIELKRGYDLPSNDRNKGCIPIISSSGKSGNHNTAKVKGPGVITGRSGLIGAVHYESKDFWPLNTTLYVKDFKGNCPEYVYYFLKNMNLKNFSTGSSVPTLNRNHLNNIEVSIHDKFKQLKQIKLLVDIDNKIETNKKIIANLEELSQTLFKHWFVDFEFPAENGNPYKSSGGEMVDSELGLIPRGWEVKSADEIYEITIGKTPPRKLTELFSEKEGIDWVSISDMKSEGMFIKSTKEKIVDEGVVDYKVKIVPKDSVLLSFKLTIGRVKLTNKELTTNEAIAHFYSININKLYTYLYLKNFEYGYLGNTSSIATAVNSKIIKKMPILVPEQKVLKRFINIAEPFMNRINIIQNENIELNQLRDTLLPKLMSGEIEIPDDIEVNEDELSI
ncbi:TPA: restriction endonuclease subunit S [Staphylococcus aureus]|uniref:restriction endonuclease subunit S n=1 Tax=Staphylococcus aureus TaxID=1280 RepID=UPI001C27488A|nr:restriction endonuclease subunit S [Staphylococcus aureus]MBU9755116.1 restriction endonuclease subunit S [Staphylococcus aureus]MBU9800998.1 restriction endonuclease subunit S [Staphylococcus aureus]MCE4972214.1 restriction endonuclease subunit S [Staphylococcus aureus]MCM0465102.1 restriction endonuclease subunit S [Staphylococcus aureus]MCM0470300.1 restriction endonuclease subunit S [Staphylococcus aureus]